MPKFIIQYIGRDGIKYLAHAETIQEAIKYCRSLKQEGSIYNVFLDFGGSHYREICLEYIDERGF